jgi:1-acyl-sn-glycerol-3-phosphate acyltransferase
MFSFLPTFILFPIHLLLQIFSLGVWALLIILLGVVKLILPFQWLAKILNPIMNCLMLCFGICSIFLIKMTNKVEWDYRIEGELDKKHWYLMMPNHLSWLDIVLLIEFSAGRIPAPKFFLKKELIWLPFIGLGAWALDMPFMQRYSRAFVEKNPHLKVKDIETTRKYCEKFRSSPTTVINFVEGSRFTPEKHQQRKSDYSHLLPPKAGGIAFTLAAMGELFTNVLDVTILYPDNKGKPMLDMIGGKLGRVVVHVNVMPINDQVVGDYFENEEFRAGFQSWLNAIWLSKDRLIEQLIGHK